MRTNKKIMCFLILSAYILLSGCSIPGGPVEVIFPANFPERQPRRAAERQQSGSVAKRFQETPQQDTAPAESAVELAEKYAKLSGEMAVLQQRNQDLAAENHGLKEQVTAVQSQLQQSQKELTEANNLLREMLVELNNWKTDILGFRSEMRDADKAQLEALLRIFQILGGEVAIESSQDADTSPVATLPSELGQSGTQKTSTSGQQNE